MPEVETAVGSFSVACIDVGLHHRLEGPFAEHEDPVETFAANGPDESFGVGICPWCSPWGANDLDALGLEDFVEHLPESMVTIVDQEPQWCRAGLTRLGQVARDLGAPSHIGCTVRDSTDQNSAGPDSSTSGPLSIIS
jgi:hypothetical protein